MIKGVRLGINIKRKKKGNIMARNLSIKQKNTYFGLVAIMYILMVGVVYEVRIYDTWYLFVATLVWSLIALFYQKSLGIKFNKEANYYLESIDKKYKYLFYGSFALMGLAISFSVSLSTKFLILLVIAASYQIYMTKKMLDYAY